MESQNEEDVSSNGGQTNDKLYNQLGGQRLEPETPIGHPCVVASDAAEDLSGSSRMLFASECHNDHLGRTLKISQQEFRVSGINQLQTRIEVHDNLSVDQSAVVFSVKHTHGNPWTRQIIIHKNVLLAGILCGISELPVDIPNDSRKMFEKIESIQQVHSYMERVLPHIRYPGTPPPGFRLYWWRAVENGAVVLQNEDTGRLIVILNRNKKLIGAAEAIFKVLDVMRNLEGIRQGTIDQTNIPGCSFLTLDSAYPTSVPASTLSQFADPERELGSDLTEAIQRWAADSQVSPWKTQLIIRTQGIRKSKLTNIRYSLDIDPTDNRTLSLQVHSNEPLSRELQAYPVCMLPMPLKSTALQHIYLRFLQALWFLKKLFDFHQETETNAHTKMHTNCHGGIENGRSKAALKPPCQSSYFNPNTRLICNPGPTSRPCLIPSSVTLEGIRGSSEGVGGPLTPAPRKITPRSSSPVVPAFPVSTTPRNHFRGQSRSPMSSIGFRAKSGSTMTSEYQIPNKLATKYQTLPKSECIAADEISHAGPSLNTETPPRPIRQSPG